MLILSYPLSIYLVFLEFCKYDVLSCLSISWCHPALLTTSMIIYAEEGGDRKIEKKGWGVREGRDRTALNCKKILMIFYSM